MVPPACASASSATSGGNGTGGASSSPSSADPHAWLESVLGPKQLQWVEQRNSDCFQSVGDPRKTQAYERILTILDSKDKIPNAYRIGEKYYYNFWQDDQHVQGIWRRTTLDSYRKGGGEGEGGEGGGGDTTDWTTVIDLDALPPPTGEGTETASTWVWHGSTLLNEGPNRSKWDRALIKLSPGGSDADTCREFDLANERWVDVDPSTEGGYEMSTPAKTSISYRSRNEVLVGTDFGGDGSTLTDSGYPRIVKSWRRGTSIEDAVSVFEGKQTDISASQYAYHDRGYVHEFQHRAITFYTSEYYHRFLTADGLAGTTADEETEEFRRVPIPDDAELGTFADSALVTLRSDLTCPPVSGQGQGSSPDGTTTYKAGSLIAVPMVELMEGNWTNAVQLFEPTSARSLSGTSETKDYVVLKILEDVRTDLVFWRYDAGTWIRQQEAKAKAGGEDDGGGAVPVGEDVTVHSHCRDAEADNVLWMWRDGFLVPDTLEMASAEDGCSSPVPVRSKPAMFDASGLTVEQHFATSQDGTRVPYFVVRRDDLKMDGTNPTLLDAYGGFEISMLPGYSAGVGAAWLERGGVKVIANIRGGGEYGPSWHQAALREKRHKCYEDVEAVAKDLIESNLTSPPKLACIGGSNGGLMVGNLITRPVSSALFGAAVCQVPLLDMKRYSHLLAGASWMAEYGDPDLPEDWKFLRGVSPYHVLRNDILGRPEVGEDGEMGDPTDPSNPSWKCPKTLFTTSTRDDRVHPAHARKMVAALLEEAGTEKAPVVYYWENTEGGHGGAADNKQRATMWALTYTFLAQALGL